MIQAYKRPVKITQGDNAGDYYMASFTRKGTVNSVGLANEMKEGSSAFTKGEVVGVTLDIPARIKQAILDGKAVTIDGLGTFKPSLTVKEIKANPDDLKTSAISIKSLNFRPDASLLAELNRQAEYQWVSIDKADSEDSDDTDSGDSTDSAGDTTDTTDQSGTGDTPAGGGEGAAAGGNDSGGTGTGGSSNSAD